MKRGFALILTLALALSLLAGCELMVPGPTERPPIGGDIEPTENADPTGENYGFTVFPEGNYLADKKFDTDEFLPDYDADPSFIQFMANSLGSAICQTDDSVYTCYTRSNPSTSKGFICYMDKATGISSILCGKPECLHNSANCNAYAAGGADGLCVYDGKLYWVSGGSQIMRMNLDGTDRETVGPVAGTPYSNAVQGRTVSLHRGYLYIAGANHYVVVNGEAKSSVSVYAQSLDSKESFTILDKLMDSDGAQCLVRPVGNDLYIMLYSFDYADKANLKDSFEIIELYRWDSETRQTEFLYKLQTSPDGLHIRDRSIHAAAGDGIYLQGYYRVGTGDDSYNKDCVCRFSFENRELEEIMWLDDNDSDRVLWPCYAKDHIVARGTGFELSVFDYESNLVFESEPFVEHNTGNFMGIDKDFVYFLCDSPTHGAHYIAIPLDGGDAIVIG